ncbi:FhaA domain-containing protein [Pseudonocardia benzenivorans]|uniref:FhaA domain-containing protein n=1 Tax=Pseudonocardia benzenivorans TaxID=228005 RepID=A0ABW3VGE6_9PSEU|nr:DUF3662 and FHA domain-containing protein [Pseudonocardia dioxanivorans]GJF02183.1 hypothetical protein PSD17_11470 [Pseudonocardia sp. D17]
MGRVERFERRLQGMVGDAFARVFGGSVVPQEVAQALLREAEDNIEQLAGGRRLAPNRYVVQLGPSDIERMAGDEGHIEESLSGYVTAQLADQGWDTYGDVVVLLERSEALHTGQFRTRSSVDPDASRRPTRARNAGEAPMSQQPGHPEENGQYGYDRGAPGYGQQTYAPPQGYDQQGGGRENYGQYDQQGGGYPQGGGGGYDQGYGQQQGGYQQGGYDQGYGQPQGGGYQQGGYDPGYGQQQGGYDQGYGQPQGGGYQQGGYDQGYQQGGYQQGGYDQGYQQQGGYDQGYQQQGGYDQGYGQQGYGGYQQLQASLSLEDGSGRNYQLTEGTHVVGRGQESHFRLPDTGVSRRHLEISWDGHNATLSDLGSTNGTTVNGSPVQSCQLTDGDVIRVGHSSLVFRAHG